MSKINRRDFLKSIGSSSLMFAGGQSFAIKALAQTMSESKVRKNFVLFRVIGGMDTLLSLHPWLETSSLPEEELFLTYNPIIEISRKVEGTEIDLGPSADKLVDFARDMVIVRGVVMGANDLGHPTSIQHISAGKTVDTAPHISSIISQRLNQEEKFFVTNAVIQKSPRQTYSTILTNSLQGINFNELPSDHFSQLLSVYKKQDDHMASFLRFLSQKEKLSLFQRIIEEQSSVLPEQYVLASLASGFSQVAQVDLIDESKNLDTHGSHVMHKEYQKMRWDRIADFLAGLRRLNLWDDTIVMVVSEFNRNPGKNVTEGKDHNVMDNAVALFGGGLNGGRVIGDHQLHLSRATNTTSLWTGSYINYKTGSTEDISSLPKNFEMNSKLPNHIDLIRPENVWATVLHHFDSSLVRQLGGDLNLIPGLFR